MKNLDCPGDLIARQRRGLSSPAELAAAEKHIAGCPSCQLVQKVGADFDAVGELRPDDDQLIARYAKLAAATAQRHSPGAQPLRRRVPRAVLLAAAALLLLAVGAAAATLLRGGGEQGTVHPSEQQADVGLLPTPAAPARLEAQPQASVPPLPEVQPATPRPGPGPLPAEAETASALFAQANEARRSGDASRAVGLYQRLQKKFPESQEGQLSRVTLGRMLLDNGSAGSALAQFDAYLAVPRGRLRLEALAGRAKALGVLSRRGEEREAWQRLLKEFPDSVYSEKARKRIGELP